MGVKQPVDFAAREDQWWHHLEPVADELGRQGRLGEIHRGAEVLPEASGRLTVVSASSDMKRALRARRRVVLMQHGIGQAYSDRSAAYPGGRGHERAALVLMPNEVAAERHRRFYQPERPRLAVVGSPRVDALAEIGRRGIVGSPPVVAVTWHWPMSAMGPEGGTAWGETGPAILEQLVRMRDLHQITLLGHAHPRAWGMVEQAYADAEVPAIRDFADVVAMADCLVADNTSVLYEFAALDRPVVVIDSPLWRPTTKAPPRFWTHADVGPRTADPQQVPSMVIESLVDPPLRAQNRRAICDDLFPHRGEAVQRAVEAILEVA